MLSDGLKSALGVAVVAALLLAVSQPTLAQGGSAPAKPSTPTVDSVAHDAVSISWTDPGDSSITGYQILRRSPAIHAQGHFEVIDDDTASTDTSYEDATVEPETRYVYRVKARNAHGLSERSSYVNATTPAAPDLTPATPARPTVDSVTHDAVSIIWADPEDSSITGYQVLRRNRAVHAQGQFEVIEDDTASTDTSYEDATVEAETRYVYRVQARNAHGLSGRSGYVTTTTPADPTPVNTAATGLPTITGTAQVGETLSADTSGISDANGLTTASFSYQWLRTSAGTDADIPGATGQTYTLTSDDQGNTVKVTVSFTDDDGYEETLTSAATDTVARPANVAATGAPTITGTAQVGETLSAATSGISDSNGLTNASFSYQWVRTSGGTDADISGATGQTYTLTSDDQGNTVKVRVSFSDDDGYTERVTSAATQHVSPRLNQIATGLPSISGTAAVGETLSVDTSAISDADGMTNAQFSYQWLHSGSGTDTEISGATDSTYTVVEGDTGKAFKVRVSFTDDAGHAERLVSGATAVVLVALQGQHNVFEPSNADLPADTSTSGTVAVGGSATGESTFNKDVDWWKVTLEANKTYSFTLSRLDYGDHGRLHNPYLHGLYDSTGTLIPGTQDDNHGPHLGAYFHFAITTAGTYYVAAGGVHFGYHALHPHFTMGGYTLSVADVTDDFDDDFAAGIGTTGTVSVGVVSAGGAISGSHTVDGEIETGGDEDWFKVALTAGKKYMIDMHGADTLGGRLWDPVIGGLYSSDGTAIANTRTDDGGVNNEARLIYTATTSGDHFIRAEDDYRYKGEYQISVLDVTAGWPDDHPADTSTTGTVSVDGSLDAEIEVTNDRDWIKVSLTAGVRYRIDVFEKEDQRGLYNPYIYGIHDSDGEFIAGTTDGYSGRGRYGARVVFTPTATGDHFINIGGAAETHLGAYTVTVEQRN